MSDPTTPTALVTEVLDTSPPSDMAAVGFRSSRHTPGFHEVRRDRETVGVIMKRATGFDVYARGSIDVLARKHTVSAAKAFARAYFAPEMTGAPDA